MTATTDAMTNDERSAMEVQLFTKNKPDRYIAYVSSDHKTITTWTGATLGQITHFGPKRSTGFGATGHSIRVRAVNGLTYSGVYYASTGDYCRIKSVRP